MTMTKAMVFIEVKLATPASSLEISVPRTHYF